MSAESYHFLVVEDNHTLARTLSGILSQRFPGGSCDTAASVAEARARIAERDYDACLLDYVLGDGTGLEVLEVISARAENCPAILLTGRGDAETAVEAMKAGAADCLFKEHFSSNLLVLTVQKALQRVDAERQRRAAEAERERSERRFRAIIENSLDGVVILGPDGSHLYSSPSTTAILGCSAEEFLERAAFDRIHPEDLSRVEEQFRSLLQSPTSKLAAEFRFRHPDGSWRWLAFVASNLVEDPAVGGIVINHRDITDRKEAEETVRYVASRARCILWYADILQHSPKSRLEWRLQFADEAAARQFLPVVVPPGQTLATAWYLSRVEEDRIRTDAYGEEKVRASESYRHEFRCRCRDGSIRWLQEDVRLERIDGNQWKAVGVCTDITDRRAAEEEIRLLNRDLEERVRARTVDLQRSNEALERSNEELEAFAYSIAHDLRGPMRAIHGYSQVLLEEYSGAIDPEGHRYLERLQSSSVLMAELMDDLLALARVSRQGLQIELVDLSIMAEVVIDSLRVNQPLRSVRVDIQPGIHAHGDPYLLRVVLENLLGNAWKFTRSCDEAAITVETAFREGRLVLCVRDNGVGFSMEYAHKLFRPFQRLHAQQEFEGTGIGLATVHRIIQRHGAEVWADGRPGEGAAIYLTLPHLCEEPPPDDLAARVSEGPPPLNGDGTSGGLNAAFLSSPAPPDLL